MNGSTEFEEVNSYIVKWFSVYFRCRNITKDDSFCLKYNAYLAKQMTITETSIYMHVLFV